MNMALILPLLALAMGFIAVASYVQVQPAIPAINLSLHQFINGTYYQEFAANSMALVRIDVQASYPSNVYLIPAGELDQEGAGPIQAYFGGSGVEVVGSVLVGNGTYALLIQSHGFVNSTSMVYEAVDPMQATRVDMPMGMVDYGVSDSNGSLVAYGYNCTGLMGIIHVYYAESSGYGIQLNGNMMYDGATYFIQDELAYGNGRLSVVVNIWNENGPPLNASLERGDGYLFGIHLLGNASTPINATIFENVVSNGTGHYLVIGANSTAGNWGIGIKLDGPAWFTVNGGELTPFGNLYDAELVIGGSGNSSTATFSSISAGLLLLAINGSAVIEPPSAWNFGADTQEGAANITATWNGNYAAISLGAQRPEQLYSSVEPVNYTTMTVILGSASPAATLGSTISFLASLAESGLNSPLAAIAAAAFVVWIALVAAGRRRK